MLYLGTVAPAKALGHREFNNATPRDPAFYEHPVRKRALGAHVNGMETFPFFAAAVLLAEFRNAPQDWIDILAAGFLLTRIAFVAAYVGDKATIRTAMWNVAFAFNLAIFFLAGFGIAGAALTMAIGVGWAVAVGLLLAVMNRRKAAIEKQRRIGIEGA